MSLRQYTAIEQDPVSNVIHWLQNRNLLTNPLRCAQYKIAVDVKERNDGHDLRGVEISLLAFSYKHEIRPFTTVLPRKMQLAIKKSLQIPSV